MSGKTYQQLAAEARQLRHRAERAVVLASHIEGLIAADPMSPKSIIQFDYMTPSRMIQMDKQTLKMVLQAGVQHVKEAMAAELASLLEPPEPIPVEEPK